MSRIVPSSLFESSGSLFLAMTEEVWMPIIGYEDFYLVSNMGKIKSMSRQVRIEGSDFRTTTERILNAEINHGYERVVLFKGGQKRHFRVSRLVCEAFHGSCPEGMECLHINGDKSDNRAENLKWGTHLENMNEPIFISRIRNAAKNGSHDSLKMAVGQFAKDGNLLHTYNSLLEASKLTGINYSNIDATCLGKRKSAGGFIWKFL